MTVPLPIPEPHRPRRSRTVRAGRAGPPSRPHGDDDLRDAASPGHDADAEHTPEPHASADPFETLEPLEPADADDDLDAVSPETPTARAAAAGPVDEAQIADWLDRIADRDERALSALYDATVTRVYGLVLRIVRREDWAEEAVEDAYFQVWRQAARYQAGRGGALAWLLGMARCRAIDLLRRELRHRHEPYADDGDDVAGAATCIDDAAPDRLLEDSRGHAALHEALLGLGAVARQLVALAFFRGLSHEEIAAQTAMPLGSVKSQIRRALLALRERLAEAGAAPMASLASCAPPFDPPPAAGRAGDRS